MVRNCSVKGCRSNYKSEVEYYTTFSLPKTEPLRTKWLQRLPNDFTQLKNPGVCIRHFEESRIVWQDMCIVEGKPVIYDRVIPKLKEGTVPTIFPDTPAVVKKPRCAPSKKHVLQHPNISHAAWVTDTTPTDNSKSNFIHNEYENVIMENIKVEKDNHSDSQTFDLFLVDNNSNEEDDSQEATDNPEDNPEDDSELNSFSKVLRGRRTTTAGRKRSHDDTLASYDNEPTENNFDAYEKRLNDRKMKILNMEMMIKENQLEYSRIQLEVIKLQREQLLAGGSQMCHCKCSKS